MAFLLSCEVEAAIRAHAGREYPLECCGAILGSASGNAKTAAEAIAAPNSHEGPRERRFLIGPEEMYRIEMEARRRKLEVVGFYHSHPDHPAAPSAEDREHAWPGYSYLIVQVDGGAATCIRSWTLADEDSEFQEETIERS